MTDITYESIADRTGEIMATAFAKAEDHLRTDIKNIADPRDGAQAPFAIGQNGAHSLIPAASWDEYRAFPLARTGKATLTQLPSFIDVVNRFKFAHSAIYAVDDFTKPSLTAIFDYHPENGTTGVNPAQPMRHRASYAFPLSEEWKAWIAKNNTAMGMSDFAQFLETRIVDVSDDPVSSWSAPAQKFAKANRATTDGAVASPTRLVDLSLKFRIYETAESCEAVNLTSGETQLTFVSEHKQADGKPVDFPKLFSITIPVFARSTEMFRIIARLRYRLAAGKPVFWYELWRHDLTFETAFNEALATVAEQTGLPIYSGTPEA